MQPNPTIEKIRDAFEGAQDHFVFVIECVPLYRSAESFDSTVAMLVELCRNGPDCVRNRVRLGVIYAKRIHSDDSGDELLAELSDLIRSSDEDPEFRLTARMVEAVILVTRCGQLSRGLSILDDLYADLRFGNSGILYGIVRRWMGYALMQLGNPPLAEAAFQDAISSFRRYQMVFAYATVLNDYAVMKKKVGQYLEAHVMLRESLEVFTHLDARRNVLFALNNLGILAMRLGNWGSTENYLARAKALLETDGLTTITRRDTQLRCAGVTITEHLGILRRRFSASEEQLSEFVQAEDDYWTTRRHVAIAHEYLGELYTETAQFDRADEHISTAQAIAAEILPHSDVMAEILRRRAQLFLCQNKLDEARTTALRCIRLSKKIGDRYELGAATRVLGEVYAAQDRAPRAIACFAAAVHMLKSIHECYELMRALHAQGRFLAAHGKRDEAEIALLEARQLTKKLELEYYQALIAIAMSDTLGPQERFIEAQSWLSEAAGLRDHLEGIDRERVDNELKRSSNDLQQLITRASVKSAETLKTICRVYEDARFPFEDMRADLAYQVAQSVGAECLFVVGRHSHGLRVPITYNISANDAKEIVRRLESTLKKKTLLDVDGEPRVLVTHDNRSFVAVPCRADESNRKGSKTSDGFVACARFESAVQVTPRQIELLCASAEALARLIEEEDVRRAPKAKAGSDSAAEDAEEPSRARHPRGSFKNILTIDPNMIKLIRTAERAAGSVAPILLEGETGVGKELFARAIHGSSLRKEGPFVAINAGGMSVHLLESELFGHVRGAFTDASNDRMGLVETAKGGTLFFDEVGEMGEEMQVKLLRLLENGEYRRLGESAMRKADVRVISATNRDLKKDAEHGAFRLDLYYRVSPVKLTIPPLRLRTSDIQLMTRHFLRECAQMNGIADRYIELDVKAMEALELYDWPGNVRELHNEILRVVSLIGKGDFVKFAMLSDTVKDFLKTNKRSEGLLDRSVEQYERRLILDALEKNDWNKLRTADAIGIPRTTLLAKLKRMNIASKSHE